MSLQADPSLLFGSSGNVLAYTTLNNYPTSPSSTTFTVDVSNSLGAYLQIWDIAGGTVNATNGVSYQVFSTPDNVWYDTNTFMPYYVIPTVASSNQRQTLLLGTGKYQIQLTNLDPANAVAVMATTGNLI